ncbi:F-box protein At3g07870-like [Camellia sinensis]|uniref:F-box protein At3g07870-like n=1 Tax=Camellia sinensis TaxID=4442 RepID=UPI00103611F8|nr:F-box protein At3g07870-like [Camellia sinensis]
MSDNLPQEVVFDILASLPVKSLLQMRCVCKSWNSLINSPNFITSHTNQTLANNNNELVLLRHHTDGKDQFTVHCNNNIFNECTTFDCPFTNWTKYYLRVVGSCGLVCLSSHDQTTILWNPSIKRCLNLPTPRITYKSHGSYTFILGFGLDPLANDFKVVRLIYFHKNFGYRLPEIRRYLILSFNISTEVFHEIKLPDCAANVFRLIASVAVYEESICLFHYDRDWGYPSKNCDIWVMKEYGAVESWTKFFTIDFGISKAVGFRKNGEFLAKDREGKLVTYDFKTRQIVYLGIHGLKQSFHLENYMESLVLLIEGNEVLEEKAKSYNALDKGIEETSELGSSINQQGSGSRGRFFCCAMPGSLTKTGLPRPSYRNLIDRPLQLERSLSQSTMLEEAENNRKL